MQKNASQKCKKDAGAKTQCKKMQITGLICFLFAFFALLFCRFFFCFCLVFFCLFVHLPRLLQLFPEIMFVQLVPGLICFFFSFFLLFAQVFQLFPKSCLSSWPLVWFVVFFARFCISIFCSFQSCFFQLCFFLLFLHLFFLLLPRLHSSFACFLLYFYFFQVENLLEQAQFDNTMFTVFALQKKRDTNHQAAARTQPRVAESLSLFPPTKSHQM